MNDTAGETVNEHVTEADSHAHQSTHRFQNDNVHLEPTRWWFASSAFPLVAGTLGPIASAFSICALVRPWRQRFRPGTDIIDAPFVDDPVWLTVVNAVQLGVALVANGFLLLNMTRRVRFTIAQPITIVGWYVSAVLLTALCATASGPLLEGFGYPLSELVWSQAFFYGIWAAVLYFITASLMVVTYYGARTERYDKDFELTTSQRTLMLQTIMFLGYLLVGAGVFSQLEGWSYLDGVYWADVTLFTVGFGDYSPSTTAARALVMPYSLIGIITLGLVIGSIRSMILERGKKRMDARMEEKKRNNVVKHMMRRGTDTILHPIPSEYGQETSPDRTPASETEAPATQANGEKNKRQSPTRAPTNEFERRREEFSLMRKIQRQASKRRKWIDLFISASCWIVLWLIGAYVFQKCEEPYQEWTYFQSVYFSFIALLTIGYGDLSPISNGGKSFFVVWSLLALPTMTVLISNAGDTVVISIKRATLQLGNVTILPGEDGFQKEIKHTVHKLTGGRMFPNYPDKPDPSSRRRPDFLQDLAASEDTETGNLVPETSNVDAGNNRRRPDIHRTATTFSVRLRRSLPTLRDPLADLPTGLDYHLLLVSEIKEITGHVLSPETRRYSFDEWAWYLKLVGEDETNPERHRAPRKSPRWRRTIGSGQEGRQSEDGGEDTPKWSWVGSRNPLMGSKEESEWILEKLTDRLQEVVTYERHVHRGV